jgi:hypothetical protein
MIHFFSFTGRKEMNKSAIATKLRKEQMPVTKKYENLKVSTFDNKNA